MNGLHPNHLRYVSSPHFADVSDLIAALDRLDPKLRDATFFDTFAAVIGIELPNEMQPKETVADQMQNAVNYKIFKTKCRELERTIYPAVLVSGIVNFTLSWLLAMGDATDNQRRVEWLARAADHFRQQKQEQTDPDQIEALESAIARAEEGIREMPQRTAAARQRYQQICEVFLPELIAANERHT